MSLGGFFDRAKVEAQVQELELELQQPAFWNDQNRAKAVTKQISILKDELVKDNELKSIKDDIQTYCMLLTEEWNENLYREAEAYYNEHVHTIEKVEIQVLLNEKYDRSDAIITIHPGAGGTESQDWAEMLLRMYKRWAEKSGYKFTIIDLLPGEEAGVKSATIEVEGEFAFGLLKCEAGIHRLVRISPFNAQGKRQTSFTSIFAYPLIDDDIEVDINPTDLKIDTYRASGAGGQHVNTTDSAVRITHIPTNIIVQCQNERSQMQNKETAMKMLRSRLYQYYEEQRDKERQEKENTKTEIGWGNQIRSYVFQPYQMVKDHRTNHEVGNTEIVMDGDLDGFIYKFLKYRTELKQNKD